MNVPMFKVKTLLLRAWACCTGGDVVYVKIKDPLGSTYTLHVKIAHKEFDPFSDGDAALVIHLNGSQRLLRLNGTVNHNDKWCYVNKSKRTAQKLAWS